MNKREETTHGRAHANQNARTRLIRMGRMHGSEQMFHAAAAMHLGAPRVHARTPWSRYPFGPVRRPAPGACPFRRRGRKRRRRTAAGITTLRRAPNGVVSACGSAGMWRIERNLARHSCVSCDAAPHFRSAPRCPRIRDARRRRRTPATRVRALDSVVFSIRGS